MPIIGMTFTSINSFSTGKRPDGEININSTPSVDDISKKDMNLPGLKDVLAIKFNFLTKYEPKIGEISIKGEVLYQTDDAKNILQMWDEKKLDAKIAVDVLNAIFRKCLTKSVTIADELNLPPPISFPVVNPAHPPKEKSAA